jgi:glutathione synthase/RimK-type ligase-like ATP-grasp enzyme
LFIVTVKLKWNPPPEPNIMDERILRIAVGLDMGGWHERFAEAIEARQEELPGLRYSLVNLDRSDWIEQIGDSAVVLWKPPYMGHEFAGYLKEKVYFLEHFLGKRVIPNYQTLWHFESKIAQSYLLRHAGVATPGTVATFDLDESMELAAAERYPIVLKKSAGAASTSVEAVNTHPELRRILRRAFGHSLWEGTAGEWSRRRRLLHGIRHEWFWNLVVRKLIGATLFGSAYWQEFIHDNSADLRITAIGDRFATGFWRNNRRGDFRASGSGLIDYERPVPDEAKLLCLDINRRLNFDSMAYDILFRDGRMLISEISYAYSAEAVHRVSGYSVLDPDGTLRFVEGHTWPQKLWVDWALLCESGG